MKSLIVLVVGLLSVGCGKTEQPLEPSQLSAEPSPANSPPNPTDQNTTKEGPVKELTPTDQNASRAEPVKELTPEEQKALRDSVVGEYERKVITVLHPEKLAFLDNGIFEGYRGGKKRTETTWLIVNGEIHVNSQDWNGSGAAKRYVGVRVHRINWDKSITLIYRLSQPWLGRPPKRHELSKELQLTYKRISTRAEKALRDSVVGEYEFKRGGGNTYKDVYLENGVRESFVISKYGNKQGESKWAIVDGEIHVKYDSGLINILRINADKSITYIARIRGGKRSDIPFGNAGTLKKIK